MITPASDGHLRLFYPKVSIVIPVFNGSNYLREAIGSALAQTYRNVEVIVVNDGSNDGNETGNIAKSYGGRLRYFSKENGGVASALNFGIGVMTGEYFSWLSHDDIYCRFKLERQIELINRLSKKDVILYSDFEIIDRTGNRMGKVAIDPRITETSLRAILSTSIHGCSTLLPKGVIDSVGLFNEKLKTTQDNEMWLRAYMKGYSFVHIPEILIQSRVHADQGQKRLASINRAETQQFYSWAFKVCSKSIHRDIWGLLQALSMNHVDLGLSVFREGGEAHHAGFLLPFFFYKMRGLFGRARRRAASLLSK